MADVAAPVNSEPERSARPILPVTTQTMRFPKEMVTGWDHWIVWRLGGRPILAALLVTVLLLASFFVPALLSGAYDAVVAAGAVSDGVAGIDPYSWAAIVCSLIGGYTVGVASFVYLNDLKDMLKLAETWSFPVERLGIATKEVADGERHWIRLVGLVCALCGLAMILLTVPAAGEVLGLGPAYGHPWFAKAAALWFVVTVPPMFYLFGKGAYFTFREEQLTSGFMREAMKIDLLHIEELAPLTRMALRRSFVWIVGGTIMSLFFLSGGIDITLLLPLFIALDGIAVAVLLPPLIRIHRRIREAKHQELAELRAMIRAQRAAIAGDGEAAETASRRLPGLVALEQRIDQVREWPMDLGSFSRFGLYLGIPLVSWFGGAFVERFVDAVLG